MDLNLIAKTIESNSRLIEIFRNCPFQIIKTIEVVNYKPEKVFIHQGHTSSILYILVSGKAEISTVSESGRTLTTIIDLEGSILGNFEIFDQKLATSNVKALTTLTLFKIKRNVFLKWIESDNNFTTYLLIQINNRFCEQISNKKESIMYCLQTRLKQYLIDICNHKSVTSNNAKIMFDKKTACSKLAVTLRSLNRSLKHLREEQLIDTQKNYIIIKDIQKLQDEVPTIIANL